MAREIDEFVPQEQEDEDINPNDGDFTISGLGSFGSLSVSGSSTFADISAGIITATQINGTIVGLSTLSVGYASTAGIATYATTAGISTYATTAGIATYATTAGVSTSVIGGIASVTQLNVTGVSTLGVTSTTNLTSQQLNVSGIVTAATYVATGTTAVYTGINTSTIDSDTTAFHYITYNTNNSAVNISNFGPGKKFEIIARNTAGGTRDLIIRTSTTTTGHTAITIGSPNGVVTNGIAALPQTSISYINVFNMNGTVIGSYT